MRDIIKNIEQEFNDNQVYDSCEKVLIYVVMAQKKEEIKHDIVEYILGNKIIICNYKKDKFIILNNGYYDIEFGMIEIFNEHNKISKLISLRYFKRLPKILYNIIDIVGFIWDQMWFQPHFTMMLIIYNVDNNSM